MTAILIGSYTPGSPEWVEARRRRLGEWLQQSRVDEEPTTNPVETDSGRRPRHARYDADNLHVMFLGDPFTPRRGRAA